VVREHDDVALPLIDMGRARLLDVEGDEVARRPHRLHVAVGVLCMGLASEAGVATEILEAVDDITPRSGCVPGCLRKLGKAAAVAVPKAAMARSCVDSKPCPCPPRRAVSCIPPGGPSPPWSMTGLYGCEARIPS
jgi:hypothetical protein